MEHRFFPNGRSFWTFFEPKCNGLLDLNATLRMRNILHFVTTDGKIHTPTAVSLFAEAMGKEFGIVVDGNASRMVNNRITLFWDEEATVEVVEEVSEATVEALEVEDEEVVEEVVETATEAADEESEVVKEVDWAWVSSLENNSEDKLKLDEYAAKFGVSLSRRKTLENMIIDFKDAIDG